MAWTHTGPNGGDDWLRKDGVRAVHHGNGGLRCWWITRGKTEYLRGKLFADSSTKDGGVRSFGSASSAMRAADKEWPVKTDPETTSLELCPTCGALPCDQTKTF